MYYSGLTYKDIKKAILNFIYNLNVPSRWGQSPFSNITIDWIVPNDMSAQYPLRNDKNYFKTIYEDLSDEEKTKFRTTVIEELKKRLENIENSIDSLFDKITYKLFQKEMNLINKAFYECLNEGDINGLPLHSQFLQLILQKILIGMEKILIFFLKMLQNMDLLISKILLVRNINEMKMVI